jgi:hypothetical protein
MPLFEEERQTIVHQENIVAALDKIRNRFGHQAIQMGRSGFGASCRAQSLR